MLKIEMRLLLGLRIFDRIREPARAEVIVHVILYFEESVVIVSLSVFLLFRLGELRWCRDLF